jgi:hypothetical protein
MEDCATPSTQLLPITFLEKYTVNLVKVINHTVTSKTLLGKRICITFVGAKVKACIRLFYSRGQLSFYTPTLLELMGEHCFRNFNLGQISLRTWKIRATNFLSFSACYGIESL